MRLRLLTLDGISAPAADDASLCSADCPHMRVVGFGRRCRLYGDETLSETCRLNKYRRCAPCLRGTDAA